MEHRDVRVLPKAHLHVHLTGSIRRSTFAELGGTTTFPTWYPRWDEFVAVYRQTKTVIRRPEDLHRLVVELIEDSAGDGAVWTEVSISPSGTHRRSSGSNSATLKTVCEAARPASRNGGIVAALDRVRDADSSDMMVELAARSDRGVVGIGQPQDSRRQRPRVMVVATESVAHRLQRSTVVR